jgi:hypothetical protein
MSNQLNTDKIIKKKVEVEAKGEFRRVAIAVEATGVDLTPQSGVWKGSKIIELEDPIDVRLTFRGVKGNTYVITLTINKMEKKIDGKLEKDGINHPPPIKLKASDFNLN